MVERPAKRPLTQENYKCDEVSSERLKCIDNKLMYRTEDTGLDEWVPCLRGLVHRVQCAEF